MFPMITALVSSRAGFTPSDPGATGAFTESASTVRQNDMTIRPITGREELDLFNELPYLLNDELADDLVQGRRRPEWMWIALQGDRLLARTAWWSRPGVGSPLILDLLDIDDGLPEPDRVDVGVRLLETATAATVPEGSPRPEYSRMVPPRWRDSTATRRPVQDRMAVLERTGARLFVERLRLEWQPRNPAPADRGRLRFRPPLDTDELLALMTRVLEGTLDAHSRDELTRASPREAAVKQYEEELARYRTPRDWWRIATLPDGEPVGFVIPAHNGYNPIIAYIAVLPEQRGNGYVDDVLAEGTRVLAGQDVPRIRASTDRANVPMARAFARAGYATFGGEINMTWS